MEQDQSQRQRPPVTFETDSFELVLLRQGPRAGEYDAAATKQLLAEHMQYVLSLVAAGKVQAAGTVVGHPPLTGLGFYHLGSIEEARRLMDEDPSIKAGLEAYDIMTFITRKGLKFANE
ncbi:MAG: YciI family protein [Chloroflexota bacterium]